MQNSDSCSTLGSEGDAELLVSPAERRRPNHDVDDFEEDEISRFMRDCGDDEDCRVSSATSSSAVRPRRCEAGDDVSVLVALPESPEGEEIDEISPSERQLNAQVDFEGVTHSFRMRFVSLICTRLLHLSSSRLNSSPVCRATGSRRWSRWLPVAYVCPLVS